MERPKEYRLQGVHFHAPSENTIDGVAYPLEMHAVHAAADGSLAVLGVMYEHVKNAHVELHEAQAGTPASDTERYIDCGQTEEHVPPLASKSLRLRLLRRARLPTTVSGVLFGGECNYFMFHELARPSRRRSNI